MGNIKLLIALVSTEVFAKFPSCWSGLEVCPLLGSQGLEQH